jgi:hypothetical protein
MPNFAGFRSLPRLSRLPRLPRLPRVALLASCLAAAMGGGCSHTSDSTGGGGAGCVSTRTYFEEQVWSAWMSTTCTKCHLPDGIAPAAGAKLVLQLPSYPQFIDTNLTELTNVSEIEFEGTSELLLKPIGKDSHGGGQVISPDGPEYASLKELVTRLGHTDTCVEQPNTTLSNVSLMDPPSTLRKVALDIAARLPTATEVSAVQKGGNSALDTAIDGFMTEPAFYDRLREIWNDTLLTDSLLAYNGAALNALNTTDYPGVNAFKSGGAMVANAALANTAIAREPLDVIAYTVQNGLPFTNILTAPYAVVNPYSAAVYGVNVKFTNPNDPTEFHTAQVSYPSGTMVPHAGVLSTPAFLNRWQTTPTNLDRGRARRIFAFFLAFDVLTISVRPVDASAIVSIENPTRNLPACTVCHEVIDPVAGGFRGYDDYDYAHFDPTTPWHDEMFPPGFDGADMPPSAYTAALPWMASQIVADPRFVTAVVNTMYQGLTGHVPIPYPVDSTASTFKDDLAAWQTQDSFLRATGTAFQSANFDLKVVVKAVINSAYYRGVAPPAKVTASPAILRDIGTGRLLTPEMLNRQIAATTGIRWRMPWNWTQPEDWLLNDYELMYGGIDSNTVTERITTPNGVIAAVAQRMSNEVSCAVTGFDFSKPKASRTLFPNVELVEVPESAGNPVPGSVTDIKTNIQYLHQLLLGETLALTDPELERTYQVFLGTWQELQTAGSGDLIWECQAQNDPTTGNPLPMGTTISQDPDYTLRSWMTVVSYLLSDYKFLYE